MKWFEILIIVAVSAMVISTIVFAFKKKSSKKGGCCGCCSKCKSCNKENTNQE